MKPLIILSALSLPIGLFAQGPNTNINPPPQSQMQNINYYDQINDNNNSLGNSSGKINDDINPIQTNIAIQQQANPPAQEQQQKSSGSIFGSNVNENKPCTDCDEVQQAIKSAHASSSSGSSHHRKSLGLKRWSKIFSGRMDMKMKRIFAKKYKAKTNYAMCFNWH